ncbi:MAG: hypothetical protein AABZ74_17015 [Cyanobacteriota bacterium]
MIKFFLSTLILLFILNTPSYSLENNKIRREDSQNSQKNLPKKILLIGDSHTVGSYGKELDSLLRKNGDIVRIYGSSGSSPSWWITGKITKSGFYSKDENGKTYNPIDWKTPHETPILEKIIDEFKPNTIIVSLGANLIRQKKEYIKKEIEDLCEIISKKNIPLIWVGPPNGRSDKKKKSEQDFLYENIIEVVKKYGYFIDSRPYTEYPDTLKGDGVHFFGEEGRKITKKWANSVFDEIQKTN